VPQLAEKRSLNKVSFALVIHSHQPVGNFDNVIEEAYRKSYAPFLDALALHPNIRVSLHYSGNLLEWIERRHPEFFEQLRTLVKREQVELLGGGYFEPILPAIPDIDKVAQIKRLADYIEERFGKRPQGAWVAERVWEPCLAKPLAEAGVAYTVLDDTHFLAAGLEPWELRGTYVTEEAGLPLRLVPSLKALRYTIPFREPEETIRILHEGIEQPHALFAMGDDCEKFGVWPGTYDHCYRNGWLERFFRAIEEASSWLETTTVSTYLAARPPLGRVYLPAASYPEMMEWALPTNVSRELKACLEETEKNHYLRRFQRFMRGGLWRNFLSKYSESNQIQKLSLRLSRRWQEAAQAAVNDSRRTQLLEQARTHLLAAQCNDAYWHGVFGGLYATHLRTALIRHLIQAESLLDQLEEGKQGLTIHLETTDFDADGQAEILVEDPTCAMIVRPADGGTVSSLRFKRCHAELINSLMRRPEPYHEVVRQRVATRQGPREGPLSIHDVILNKESNLDALLRYDRYARHAFRTLVFPAGKRWEDYERLQLQEHEELAGGPWRVVREKPPGTLELRCETPLQAGDCRMQLTATKRIVSKTSETSWHLECRSSLSTDRACPVPLALGLELVFNLLAPEAHDRYFVANDVRRPLDFRGEITAPRLGLVDEWQRVRITLEAHPAGRWWITPIEAVSQSESGIERVYQGSAILLVWKIEPPSWRNVTCTLRAEISSLDQAADRDQAVDILA